MLEEAEAQPFSRGLNMKAHKSLCNFILSLLNDLLV
jgi:hypothetical protein